MVYKVASAGNSCLKVCKAASAVVNNCTLSNAYESDQDGDHPPGAITVLTRSTQLQAKNVVINSGFRFGLDVNYAANASLESCRIYECTYRGLHVQGSTAGVKMVECRIVRTKGVGVSMVHDATVNLTQCTISHSQQIGVSVAGDESDFVATK